MVNRKLGVFLVVGFTLIVVMIVSLTYKKSDGDGKNNSVAEIITTNSGYDELGIPLNLSRYEQEHIDAITEAMEYLALKYGEGRFIYTGYERVDSITENIYALDGGEEKYIVFRMDING